MRLVDADSVIDLFGISDRDIYAKETIEEALYDGTLEIIEPEREKGEWVNARDGYDGHVKCNKCFKTYDWTSDAQYFNFCPNCGADMRGENIC